MSLEGRLEDLGLTDIFQIIGLSKKSGVLTVIHKAGTGRLVFHEGNVMYATSDRKSRFGYTLLQKGIITYEELEEALKVQKTAKTRKPLGTLLVEMGIVSQDVIEKFLKEHIIDVVKDLLTWDTGSFHFDLGVSMETDVILPMGLSAEYLLLEGARLQDEEERDKPHEQAPSSGRVQSATSMEVKSVPEPTQAVSSEPLTFPQRGRKDLTLLTAMIEEISGPSNSSEVILMILRFASEMMNRAVIFLVRDQEQGVVGLGQFGLTLKNGSADQLIRGVKIPLTQPSCFSDVVAHGQTFRGALEKNKWNEYLVQQLGGHWPLEVLILPLLSDGKVIAILYGDNAPPQQKIENSEGLEAFMRVAGFAFGKAILERKLQATRNKAKTG